MFFIHVFFFVRRLDSWFFLAPTSPSIAVPCKRCTSPTHSKGRAGALRAASALPHRRRVGTEGGALRTHMATHACDSAAIRLRFGSGRLRSAPSSVTIPHTHAVPCKRRTFPTHSKGRAGALRRRRLVCTPSCRHRRGGAPPTSTPTSPPTLRRTRDRFAEGGPPTGAQAPSSGRSRVVAVLFAASHTTAVP